MWRRTLILRSQIIFHDFIYFLFVAFVAVTIAGFFSGTGIEACLEV